MASDTEPAAKKSKLEVLVLALPGILWVVLGFVALAVFQEPLSLLLQRATKLKVGDVVEIETQIALSANRLPVALKPETNSPAQKSLAQRWLSLPRRERPYRILVAHDDFLEAKPIQAALTELGFGVDIGLCPQDIETLLRRHVYDAVISDVRWQTCPSPVEPGNGIAFLKYATERRFARPTVFFIRDYKPALGTPAYAAGISNNWYDVLHYLLDILARQGGLKG